MPRLTRRAMLAALSAGSMLSALPAWCAAAAGRRAGGDPAPRLVVINLRGGLDGLAAVPPYGDPAYRAARRGLALPIAGPGRVIDLDGGFGLHPALAALHGFFARGEMLVMPASAFIARDKASVQQPAADPSPAAASHAAGQGNLAAALRQSLEMLGAGCPQGASLAWQSLGAVSAQRAAQLDLVADLSYGSPAIGQSLAALGWPVSLPAAFSAEARLFSRRAGQLGESLAAGDAAPVTVLESGGWDSHSDQGVTEGRLAIALAGLAEGIAALAAASGTAWRRTAVLVVSEFGRAVAMNAMGGTDHGTAGTTLLLGGNVAGGRVIGSWPGLAKDRLVQGQGLRPVTDLAGVMRMLVAGHMLSGRDATGIALASASASIPLPPLLRG